MKKSIEITGIISEGFNLELFSVLLESAGVTNVKIKTLPEYNDWLKSLPKEDILGFKSECLDWIRHWGNGGGDESSKTLITDAIEYLTSNDPVEFAEAVYNAVVNYTKSEFDAAGLTIEMIDACVEECLAAFYEQINNEEENSE